MQKPELKGQVALVTGANRGIGREIAQALASAGAVVMIAARDINSLDLVKNQIESTGGACEKIEIDVTNALQVRQAIDQIVLQHGKLDLLVNNAGIGTSSALPWEQDVDAWWKVQEVNLRGAFLCSHAALGHMTKKGAGRIIDIGSLVGASANPRSSAYAVSKIALQRMSTCFAGAAKEYGVRIFTISPGLVATDMTNDPFFKDIPEDQWTPIDKSGELVVALATGKADRLTGRFFHAGLHDLNTLIERTDEILEKDLLTLSMDI